MEIVAGIDGGGTGTTLKISTLGQEFQEEFRFGPFNINSIGPENFGKLIDDIYDKLDTIGEPQAIVFGAAGISNPTVSSVISEKAVSRYPDCRIILKGDHEIALEGAMAGEPGAIVISGTGSIALGVDPQGRTIRIGGWGHLIDDCGSGYAIGREALSYVVKAYDGRRPNTGLCEDICKALNATSIKEIISGIYGKDKSVIASLSRVVEASAADSDNAACRILDGAAEDIVEIIATMYSRLGMRELNLSLMGGMLSNDTILRKKVVERLNKELPLVHVIAPRGDAVTGALSMAFKAVND